jgi:hypothetical protein
MGDGAMTLGRDNHLNKKGAPTARNPGRRESKGVDPMDPTRTLRDEPTVAELIAAREQTDAGNRSDPKPEPIAAEIDEALIGRAGEKVARFRDEFVSELHHLDKHAPRRLYIEAQAMVSECDDFLATVAAHFREVGS